MKAKAPWFWLVLLVPIGLGLARLRFDVEVLNLLPQGSPVVQGLKLYQENFSNARELIVAVESESSNDSETTARVLAEAWRGRSDLVRRVIWQPPWLESPSETAEFLAYLWLNQPATAFSNVVGRLREPALSAALTEARERLATSFSPREIAMLGYDPLQLTALPASAGADQSLGSGDQLFVSTNGQFRVLFVEAAPDLSGYQSCRAWLSSLQAMENELRGRGLIPSETSVHYTGRPAFVAEIAGGMERDMNASIAGTMVIISALFYGFHRRWKPLLWLLTLLILILGGTMALGALIFGTLSVISLGFAAILLGLAVDYGLVLYQEARMTPAATIGDLRRSVGPSILWSAITTSAAFALLNLSSLPGLSQLGSLVAVGVLLGSAVMILALLPPLVRPDLASPPQDASSPSPITAQRPAWGFATKAAWAVTFSLLAGAIWIWWARPLRFDHTADALRPRQSPAYATVELIKSKLGRPREPLWILVSGHAAETVRERLEAARSILEDAQRDGLVTQFTLPTALWPYQARQETNAALAASLPIRETQLEQAFAAQGFTKESAALTERFLATWQHAALQHGVYWPSNAASQWILGQVSARTDDTWIALGFIHMPEDPILDESTLESLRARLAEAGANLSGWELLGPSLFRTVGHELAQILWPMALVLTVCLGFAFRGGMGILLSYGTILASGCALLLIMTVMGWTWNLMNLMALPLLLGVGIDYSIHIQLAMKRHHGNMGHVRATTGRALLLCAMTTATGFGSLGLSANAGLAALGKVCAAGLLCCYVVAVHLLPVWWKKLYRS